MSARRFRRLALLDLIETLWNVKINHDWEHPEFSDRFNRDIVECNGISFFVMPLWVGDLIETLWNVKYLSPYWYQTTTKI